MQNEHTDPSGREQNISFTLDAPVELVWEVWTRPEHIQHWWGPNGFTNTIKKMEVQPGGEWIFTMHGPGGESYPNKTNFRDVVQHQKLVHEHYDPNFIAIIHFESNGNQTMVNWYKLYETKELFELVEKQHSAGEGLLQTAEKLVNYLDKYKDKPQ